jgi:small conductance mechanosensitive channel
MLSLLLAQSAPADDGAAPPPPPVPQDVMTYLTPERITELVQQYGLPLLFALVILVAAYLLAGIANRAVRRSMGRAKVDETLARFFGKMARYTVLILGLIVALGKIGVEVTAFAAILASAGFAVGMALSGTLGHFASGVMLLIFRPFKIGDVVSAGGITGKVYEISLFTTAMDTPDNRRIIVPNGAIYGATIENISHHDTRRVDVGVGVDYSADIDKTREVLGAAAQSIEGILSDPAHAVVLGDLGDSSVNWTVRVWCNAADYWGIKEAATRAVKQHLDDAGIGIPFPQMDVHMDKVEG